MPEAGELKPPPGHRPAPCFGVPVPEDASAGFPRLRRSSAISHFACAAARDAWQQAQGRLQGKRTAIIFAASNGAVIYTRRFYADVVERGSGSPLLFPETVYNAAASHVAALLGVDEPVLTLVGDSNAGLDALQLASEMIADSSADACLVVAAEEADWMVWEAYRRWKMVREHATKPPGAVLTEGAVALVVGRAAAGETAIGPLHRGASYHRRSPAGPGLQRILRDLLEDKCADLAVTSASGTRMDSIESAALDALAQSARRLAPRTLLGEAFAVSTLVQVLCAWLAVRDGTATQALVPVTGWNGRIGGTLVGISRKLLTPEGARGTLPSGFIPPTIPPPRLTGQDGSFFPARSPQKIIS